MSKEIKQRVQMDYYFERVDGQPIPDDPRYEEALSEAAMARITEMTEQGFISGELAENMRLTDEDGDEGVDYRGWWSYQVVEPKPDTQHAFDYAVNGFVNDTIALIKEEEGEDYDPDSVDLSVYFDDWTPPCDLLSAREFLPSDVLIGADAGVFEDTLLKSPSFDLLEAARDAANDALKDYCREKLTALMHGS